MLTPALILAYFFLVAGIIANIGAHIFSSPKKSLRSAFAYSGVVIGVLLVSELTGLERAANILPQMVFPAGLPLLGLGIALLIVQFWAAMRIFDLSPVRAFWFLIFLEVAMFGANLAATAGVTSFLGLQPIPAAFQGAYSYDVPANTRFLGIRFPDRIRYAAAVAQKFGSATSDIGQYTGLDVMGGKIEWSTFRIIEKGQNFLIFDSFQSELNRNVRYRVDFDSTGLWVSANDPIPNFSERYRRNNPATNPTPVR